LKIVIRQPVEKQPILKKHTRLLIFVFKGYIIYN